MALSREQLRGMTCGEYVRHCRRHQPCEDGEDGISQTNLAERLDEESDRLNMGKSTSRHHISKWENDHHDINMANIWLLYRVLELFDIQEFFICRYESSNGST